VRAVVQVDQLDPVHPGPDPGAVPLDRQQVARGSALDGGRRTEIERRSGPAPVVAPHHVAPVRADLERVEPDPTDLAAEEQTVRAVLSSGVADPGLQQVAGEFETRCGTGPPDRIAHQQTLFAAQVLEKH
jgi:hypothetical protein